ncbi:MAG: hypothetical protein WCJ93_11830 [Methanomicrobiales archaeon]
MLGWDRVNGFVITNLIYQEPLPNMKFKEIILGIFILLILFFVVLTVFPTPVHDVLYGKYVDGSVAVTALHSGNDILVTNYGGPDLIYTEYIKVIYNNQTYLLNRELGSTLTLPYNEKYITIDVGILKTHLLGSEIKDFNRTFDLTEKATS